MQGERARLSLLAAGLADPSQRPAIVYAGTRARCEDSPSVCARPTSRPRPTTRAWVRPSAMRARRASWPPTTASWWRRPRSAWASTRRMCARSGTGRCRRRSRATTRSRAVPGATESPPAACCSTRPPTVASSRTSSASPRSSRDDVNNLLALVADAAMPTAASRSAWTAWRALRAWSRWPSGSAPSSWSRARRRGARHARLRAVGHRRASEVERASKHFARQRWDALAAITAYAAGGECRRTVLLRHFRDPHSPAPAGRCCDVCEPPGDLATGGIDVTALRAAVLGAASAARPAVGRTGLDQILRGLDRMRARYGDVPGFGSAAGHGRSVVLSAIDAVVAEGELVSSGGARPVLRRSGAASAPAAAPAAPVDADLSARLRDWRLERARSDGVPAYVVATNACLDEVCRRLPGDTGELAEVPGMGPARVERYGDDLLELVRAACRAGASRAPLPV